MSETKYAVFSNYKGCTPSAPGLTAVLAETVDDALLDFLIEYGEWWTPVAWAAEYPSPARKPDVVRCESIVAGRLIELVDGKYVARGSMTPTLDKLEAEKRDAQIQSDAEDMQRRLLDAFNRSMVARDDTAAARFSKTERALRKQIAEIKAASKSTAHKPLPALTRMSEGDHRFGRFSGR